MQTEEGGQKSDCTETWREMYNFLDREVTEGKRRHVQAHLDDCHPCLEAFEFEAELKAMIAKKCRDDVPIHLIERVKMQISMEISLQESERRDRPE